MIYLKEMTVIEIMCIKKNQGMIVEIHGKEITPYQKEVKTVIIRANGPQPGVFEILEPNTKKKVLIMSITMSNIPCLTAIGKEPLHNLLLDFPECEN